MAPLNPAPSPPPPNHLLSDALAGCLAGAVSKTFIAPIDRVKLLLQLQTATSSSVQYNGAVDVISRTLKHEGALSFWRGNMPAVYRHIGTTAFTFSLKDQFRNIALPFIYESDKPNSRRRHLAGALLSGGAAGLVSCAVFYPLDYVRTLLALDHGRRRERSYRGMRDVINATVKLHGIAGVYNGFGVAVTGSVLFRALHLGLYDFGKHSLRPDQNTFANRFCVAQFVSIMAGTLCYPLDSVRRRLMMQGGEATPLFTTTRQCVAHILKNEGRRGFFLGLAPNLFRSVGGAVLLVSYDEFKSYLSP